MFYVRTVNRLGQESDLNVRYPLDHLSIGRIMWVEWHLEHGNQIRAHHAWHEIQNTHRPLSIVFQSDLPFAYLALGY